MIQGMIYGYISLSGLTRKCVMESTLDFGIYGVWPDTTVLPFKMYVFDNTLFH